MIMIIGEIFFRKISLYQHLKGCVVRLWMFSAVQSNAMQHSIVQLQPTIVNLTLINLEGKAEEFFNFTLDNSNVELRRRLMGI